MGNTVRKVCSKVINIHEVSNAVPNVNANQAELNGISVMDTTELKIENNSNKNGNLTTNEKIIDDDDEDWIFKCFTCGFRATNFGPLLCDSCGFMSSTVIHCIKHHELHHALKDGYLCAICGFSTFDFYAASVHNKNCHRKRKREFDDCSEIDLKRVKSQEDSTPEVGPQTETEEKNISEESTQTECETKIETKDAECQTDEIYENSTSTLIRNSTPLTTNENEKRDNFQSFNEIPNSELSHLELRNLSDLFCVTLMNMVKEDPSIINYSQLPTCSNAEQNINDKNYTPLSKNVLLSLKQENSVNSSIRVPEIENQMILTLNKIKDCTQNEPNEETPNDTNASLNSQGSNERGRSSGRRRGRGSRGPRRATGGRSGSRRPVGRPKKQLDDDFEYTPPKAHSKRRANLMSFSSSDEDDVATTASTSTTSQPVLPTNREDSDSDELPEFDFLSQP